MSERIEAYVSDLDARLARHIEAPRRTELIDEVRSHLAMASKAVDEKEALRAFGPVRTVAEDLIRREKGLDTKPAWKLALWPILLLLVAILVPSGFWLRQDMTLYDISEWASKLFVIVFAWSVWRTRRWLALSLVAPLILATVIHITIDTNLALRAEQMNRPDQIKSYATWIGDLEKKMPGYEKALRGDISAVKAKGGYEAPLMGPSTITYHIALLPTTFGWGSRDVPSIGVFPSEKEARDMWTASGARFMEAQREVLNDLRTTHAELVAGTIGFKLTPEWALRVGAMWAVQLVLIFGLNALVLGAAKLNRNRHSRRDPHLA